MKSEFGPAVDLVSRGGPGSHSLEHPPVSRTAARFPLLIFSHGFGESVLTYAALLEDLASHGYVVVGIAHPGDAYAVAYPDGRVIPFADSAWQAALRESEGAARYQLEQVPIRADDISFVLQRLRSGTPTGPVAGHFDAANVGVFGHSLGGMAAAHVCARDPGIRACMNQDAEYRGFPFLPGDSGAIHSRFLFLASEHSMSEGLLQRIPDNGILVAIKTSGFRHRSFIDLTLLGATDSAEASTQRETWRWCDAIP